MSNRHPLVVKLKSGEYDGTDLMQAWLLIEELQSELERIKPAAQDVVAYCREDVHTLALKAALENK
jgi:hypothetical protein